jgi:dinuclear metal center YbgI/SA1388 family protein
MSLKVKDIMDLVEELAPIRLKESYDNVGLMVGDSSSIVTSILVALDCTLEVIREAREKDCNLILTHHPLLFRKPSSITTDTLVGRKIIELIKNDINLYSCHTNLDSVAGGMNDLIAGILGYTDTEVIDPCSLDLDPGLRNGLGRIVTLHQTISLGELCMNVKEALELEYVRYSGDEAKMIRRLAIINGSGQDYFRAAVDMGADCVISGDTTYHYVSDYSEQNLAIIDAGHFSTEWPAMKLFAITLSGALKREGFQNSVIISNKTKDPYKYR